MWTGVEGTKIATDEEKPVIDYSVTTEELWQFGNLGNITRQWSLSIDQLD